MSTQFPIFAFALGREFKLSVAEIASACPECRFVSVDPKLAVVDGINTETALSIFSRLGGSVRVFEILSECTVGDFARRSTDYLKTKIAGSEGKHSFALAAFGGEVPLFDAGLRVKKALKEEDLSVRLCNVENRTINAASFKKDHLSKTRLECAYLETEGGAKYFAVTLACQDVDEFSKRDLGKGRSMEVGMLPPKLARIMVNLTKGKKRSTDDAEGESTPGFFAIYDPFCGLGTVLIEAADLGFSSIAGSDVEPKMVESTKTSLEDYAKRKHVTFDFSIKTLDAKKIGTEKTILETAAIVTEGYLGDILTQKTATPEKIDEQKRRLIAIYRGFFSELKRIDFKNPIVMCIPFWDIGGTFTFFEEFFDILKECGYYSEKLLPESLDYYPTKFWSLLYRRSGQTVGREVVRIIPGRTYDGIDRPHFHKKNEFWSPRGFDSKPHRPGESKRSPTGGHKGGGFKKPDRPGFGRNDFGTSGNFKKRGGGDGFGGGNSGGKSFWGGRVGGANRGR